MNTPAQPDECPHYHCGGAKRRSNLLGIGRSGARLLRFARNDGHSEGRNAMAYVDPRLRGKPAPSVSVEQMEKGHVARPDLKPKIAAPPHGFAVTYVRHTPKGHGAALHRHPTEEVFIAAKGPWEVFWLEGAVERTITLQPGDIVNVPIGIYRGFRNAGEDPEATLIAVVGGPDTGKVDWHPSVIEAARQTGLSVDDDGKLIVADAAE